MNSTDKENELLTHYREENLELRGLLIKAEEELEKANDKIKEVDKLKAELESKEGKIDRQEMVLKTAMDSSQLSIKTTQMLRAELEKARELMKEIREDLVSIKSESFIASDIYQTLGEFLKTKEGE